MRIDKLRKKQKKRNYGYPPYEEAEAFVRSLNLKSQYEWAKWYIENHDKCKLILPMHPEVVYGYSGRTWWKGWGEFLGTFKKRIVHEYLPYEQAREWAQKTKFKSCTEWRRWFLTNKEARPSYIPANPKRTYTDKGWKGWDDFLGENHNPKTYQRGKVLQDFAPYGYSRKWARSLGLKSRNQWHVYVLNTKKLPKGVPKDPEKIYRTRGTWCGWKDFLGVPLSQKNKKNKPEFINFDEARDWARTLKLKHRTQLRKYLKENKDKVPKGMPLENIERVYEKSWTSWEDFLGCEKAMERKIRELKDPDIVSVYIYHSGVHSFNTFGVYACKKDSQTMRYYFNEKRIRIAKIYTIKDEHIQEFMNEIYRARPIHSTSTDEIILNNPSMAFEYWDGVADKLNSPNR